jgi:integrase
VLEVLATTGIRVGELASLDVDSVHVERGAAYIEYVRKGRKATQTKLPTETLLVVMRQIDTLGRATGPLFVGDTGTRIDRRGVQRVITRLAVQVGISRHVTPHGLRRTFASTARRLGASHSDIQHALHQADPRTTDLYLRGDKGGSVSRHLVAELLAS